MKLITEEVTDVKFITEGKGGKKKMYIEGVFLQGDICNRNKRMYPMETLSREVDRYSKTFIKEGRALGELGHPDGPTVNLDRVSHKIVSLTREGKNYIGKYYSTEYVRKKVLRQTDDEIIEIDKQIDDEIEKGIIPDPSMIDPITGEPLPQEGEMGMGEVPVEPDLEAEAQAVDAQYQKDTKKAEI